jgi:hypothetical protein
MFLYDLLRIPNNRRKIRRLEKSSPLITYDEKLLET